MLWLLVESLPDDDVPLDVVDGERARGAANRRVGPEPDFCCARLAERGAGLHCRQLVTRYRAFVEQRNDQT